MKKILHFALVLALLCQLSAPAFAGVGKFRIGVADTMYGLVAISAGAAEPGSLIRAEGRPTEGFELSSFKVMADGKEVPTEIVNGQFTFTMPAAIVTIYATFDFIATELFPFADVPENAWCRSAVEYVFEHGIMNGSSASEFFPNATTNRAMIWMMLARDAGAKITQNGGNWYDAARTWAMREGISDGEDPLGEITREELAVMLYRYAQKKGEGFTGSWYFLLKNPDAREVSAWADEAMHWCVMKGILTGRADGSLDPQGKASRAEVATVMMRYMER